MKQKIINIALAFVVFTGILFACDEDEGNTPLENNTEKPGVITNVQVQNLPGKAVISYTLPNDQDLLYVKAVYTLPSTGQTVEVKASYYINQLMVDGFIASSEQEVKLYAVNRSEVQSDPVSVTIKPLESPIWDIRRSLVVAPHFGGFNIRANNLTQSDVAILLLKKNDLGEWEIDDNSIYTSVKNIIGRVRGLDTINYEYAVTIRDRWQNYTDTLFTTVKPLFETLIPKSGYVGLKLPGDAEFNTKTAMKGMWDGDVFNWPNVYQTRADFTPTLPHVITINIGKKARLSRVKIWDYPEYFSTGRTYYTIGCMKHFEIWGAENYNPDGSFDNWMLLGTFMGTKPSGLPLNQQNDEDFNAANAGFDWSIDIETPKVQYIRIRCLENWGGSTYLAIAELQVYGDPR